VWNTTRKPAKRVPKQAPEPTPRDNPPPRRSFGASLGRALVMLVAFVFMVGFAVVLAKLTLQPSPGSVALIHTNLKPGDSIRQYVDQPAFRDTVKQIGGNLLLGVPFGVLLPVLFPRTRGLLRVVLVTAFVMVLVEIAQGMIVEGRAFDIDDVILNTTGALVGYLLLGRRLGRALHPRRHHWWQRRQPSEAA
jgi:glycopeptide antibiotics resistance protein